MPYTGAPRSHDAADRFRTLGELPARRAIELEPFVGARERGEIGEREAAGDESHAAIISK
jgi:hypothetical protein